MNLTTTKQHPAVADYVLRPRPPLITGISDYTLSLIVPPVTHWLTAAIYESFEYFQLFQRYKIHSTNEEKTKNTISRLECLRGVLLVQFLQTCLGIVLGMISPEVEVTGYEDHDIAVWISRIHVIKRTMVTIASFSGLDVNTLAATLSSSLVFQSSNGSSQVGYEMEVLLAKLTYWVLMPALRLYAALWLADTWVFFVHRAEHNNRWLYKNFHARHHELYVPYSWGGIYDQPFENMFLSVGAFVIAVMGTGMSLRESIVFSAFSSVKACTDHSGYAIPWNPIDAFTTVGAAYHDKHHQRWGLKKNFALHFQFWDRLLGTDFKDMEAAARFYERDHQAAEAAVAIAQMKVEADKVKTL